jgi:uncharacterized membrane protein YdbT with pleckstrin-like domain
VSYIQNNLVRNEKIVFFTRMHGIIFAGPVVLLIAAIILSVYAPLIFRGYFPFSRIPLGAIVVLVCLAAAIFSGVGAFIRYTTSEYAITNRRIMVKTGWIRRNSLEILLDKVEAIYVDQTILGRILNYGTIRIVGTGGTQDPFLYIPSPLIFRKYAEEQLSRLSGT